MLQIVYKDSAGELTLEEAMKAYEAGISISVNDGRDITVPLDREPTDK